MNYYQILGVTKKATNDEIKTSYRKLIKMNHPDVGGDPNVFFSIQRAYETLIDPDLREEYECQQHFFSFYESNNNTQTSIENEDIRIPLELTLKDVLLGKDINITYRLKNGQTESAEIIIPPGVSKNTNIIYDRLGENCNTRKPRGNLIFEISIINDKNWKIKDNDLHTSIDINALDMIIGTRVPLELPDESNVEIVIPKGTQNDTVISISDCGIPDLNTRKRGKVFVKIKTKIPKIKSDDIITRLQEIRGQIN